ncbi:hypothetical protein [Alysiella crassa]|uniref:Uncharacterized protein n=1 Tax=Alysiella crassa TaxID=153491 RepID=A0A376BWE3_9NEIS|nr:hypothetical protein [Alysiella crassa]SSY81108.1 Uncharacterised protein [Alysiella crassa]
MHIQRNSLKIRKYIESNQYFQLQENQLSKTYIYKIGRINCAPKDILERIWELEALEKDGFVYLGEKNWLQDCLKERSFINLEDKNSQQDCLAIHYEYPAFCYPTYDKWIIDYLAKYLNIQFVKTENNDIIDYYYITNRDIVSYKGTLNLTPELFLNFSQLNNQSYQFTDELDLYLLGNHQGVFPNSICKLFEVLHNLEYYITMLPELFGVGVDDDPLSIDSLVFDNLMSSEEFMINTFSVYGADLDYFFVGNKFRGC